MGGLVSRTDAVVLLDYQYQTAKMCAVRAKKRAEAATTNEDRARALALSREFECAAAMLDKCISKIMVMQPIKTEVMGYGRRAIG